MIRCGREKKEGLRLNFIIQGVDNKCKRVWWKFIKSSYLNNDKSAHQIHSRPKLKFFPLIQSFLLFVCITKMPFYSFDKVILNEQKVQHFPNFELKLAFSFHWTCKHTWVHYTNTCAMCIHRNVQKFYPINGKIGSDFAHCFVTIAFIAIFFLLQWFVSIRLKSFFKSFQSFRSMKTKSLQEIITKKYAIWLSCSAFEKKKRNLRKPPH